MSKVSRHHHYLSQCYLRGFTKSGCKNSKLTVFDLNTEKIFESNTRNVGGVRDFDRIDFEGIDPDIINQQLSDFESLAASSLRKIDKDLAFEGKDKENILNLIALLSIRSPQRREHWRNFQENLIKRMLEKMLYSKEIWEKYSDKTDEGEGNTLREITYEQAKKFYKLGNLKVLLSTAHHIEMEMIGLDAILPLLANRKWILVQTSDESGPFITSDRPVFLVWKDIEKIPAFWRNSPGHGMKNTQIQFPISQNLALLGEFEGSDGIIQADKNFVSILNSKMLLSVHERIFSPKIQFNFIDFMSNDGSILNGSQLISYVKKLKKII